MISCRGLFLDICCVGTYFRMKMIVFLCIPLVGTCGDAIPKYDIENSCYNCTFVGGISNTQLVQRFSSFRRSSLQISDEANICHLSPHLTIAHLTNKAVSKKGDLYSND